MEFGYVLGPSTTARTLKDQAMAVKKGRAQSSSGTSDYFLLRRSRAILGLRPPSSPEMQSRRASSSPPAAPSEFQKFPHRVQWAPPVVHTTSVGNMFPGGHAQLPGREATHGLTSDLALPIQFTMSSSRHTHRPPPRRLHRTNKRTWEECNGSSARLGGRPPSLPRP